MGEQFTKGPWEYVRSPYTADGEQAQFHITPVASCGLGWVTRPADDPCGVGQYMQVGGICSEADAKLIASCPDLVEALRVALPSGVDTGNTNIPDTMIIPVDFTMGELRQIKAALSRATGEG